MSPARQLNRSPRGRQIARQPIISPRFQVDPARRKGAASIPTPSSQPSARAENCCISGTNKGSSLKGIPQMQCFISRQVR